MADPRPPENEPARPSDAPEASRRTRGREARRYTAREVGGFFVVLLGAAIVASGLLVNPWVGRLVQGPYVVDKADVLLGYFLWSVALGAAVVALGVRFGRRPSDRLDGLVALALPLAFLVLLDRLLLVHFGLPIWRHDPELQYRHRPGVVRTLARAGRPDAQVRINRHGHHDNEHPVEKPEGELRGLMIGDSITMGDQVPYEETFSAQLEALLARHDAAHPSHEIINTGVHGYTTLQERVVLRESLRFDPDFVAIGFCMNDVTEPAVVRREVAEGELTYHGVAATASPLRGWLMNETGLGRLAQAILGRSRTLAGERLREDEAVRRMAARPASDPEVAEAWRFVLADLEAMYALSREHGVEPVLLVFPFTFQLADPALREPQAILANHAAHHDVPVIDFTPIFAARVYDDPDLVALLRGRGYDAAALERVFAPRIRRYFLDADHLTAEGHRVVAEHLLEHLVDRGLVRTRASADAADPLS